MRSGEAFAFVGSGVHRIMERAGVGHMFESKIFKGASEVRVYRLYTLQQWGSASRYQAY